MDKKLLKYLKKWKFENLQFCDNWAAPSAKEEAVIQWKAPEPLLNGPRVEVSSNSSTHTQRETFTPNVICCLQLHHTEIFEMFFLHSFFQSNIFGTFGN